MQHALEDILKQKGDRLITTASLTPIREAVQVMNESRVGALLITARGKLAGIFTERDVLRRVVDHDIDLGAPVEAVMTTPVQCAPKNMAAGDAMQWMTKHRYRHLPVIEHGIPIGIVSIGDLMRWATRELEQSVTDLSTFICGPASSIELPPTSAGSLVLLHAVR